LAEIEGVVSTQSFELLIQWLYLGRVIFGDLAPEDAITATISFVRIADMCGVTGMEHLMANRIKAIILHKPSPTGDRPKRNPGANTDFLVSQHIRSAALLPDGHPIRNILANAAVEGYLISDGHKFLREAKEVTSFSYDLLTSVKATLKTLKSGYSGISFKDPLSGDIVYLGK
jgi:hypothetical protein